MSLAEDIVLRLSPVVEGLGLELDGLKVVGSGKTRVLEVTIDSDNPIDLDQIAEVSRAISEVLDATDVMGSSPYTLEVSTRGVGTPLTRPVHWKRNVGRLVTLKGAGIAASGRIIEFDEPTVTVNVKGQNRKFDLAQIDHAVVEVEFNRKDDA